MEDSVEYKIFISLLYMKRNASSTVVRDSSQSYPTCVSCSTRHPADFNAPLAVFLTDQNFPPSLPVEATGCCMHNPHELPGLLKEFVGGLCAGDALLPEGSVVVLGSISHLAERGLSSYVNDLVRANANILSMCEGQVRAGHYIWMPLCGISNSGLIRDLADLDSWLSSARITNAKSLPSSRKALWEVILRDNTSTEGSCTGPCSFFSSGTPGEP